MKQQNSKPLAKWIIPFAILTIIMSHTAISQEIESYPQPVSEYVEKTAPGTMTFLSYPKYYRNANNDLQLTDTTLRPSDDPNWDYQVTAGIWSLHVRTDGTFRASHAGDRFTYRFADVGIGRGSSFRSLGLGEAQWNDFIVMGDTIRWNNVLPDVDMSVRYIHDILKVDVIVNRELVQQIRNDVNLGNLPVDGFLTAKFDIPSFLMTGEARMGNEIRDLYGESLEVNQPVRFLKNDELYHSLRPVNVELLNESGEPVILRENNEIRQFRTAQLWQLLRSAPGTAEMSLLLDDILELPDGDIVIDPSFDFQQGSSGYTGCEDSTLYLNENENPDRSTYNCGGMTYMFLWAYDSGLDPFFDSRILKIPYRMGI